MRRPVVPASSFEDEIFEPPVRATQSDQIEVSDLDAALAYLPEEQRAVLLLVALEDMSYAEIAEMLGIPVGTVMSRLARGRERLRQMLDSASNPVQLKVVR